MITWDTPEQVKHARVVVQELERARRALAAAEIATADEHVARGIHQTRKLLLPALRRAQAVLAHVDLLEAGQPDLGL